MDKKNKNKFDLLVEDLVQRFSKIEDFSLISESESTTNLWNYVVRTIVSLNSLKTLFVNIYIPQTNKFIYESKEDFKKSKYSHLLALDEELWKEETNELVRIGYVTLFHKYENFTGAIFPLIDRNFVDSENKSITIKQYALDKFQLKVDKEWYINSYIKRLNWICNSQKHNDGFPQTSHPYYKEDSINEIIYPSSKKIEISAERLKNDAENMPQFIISIFQVFMQIALYRMMEELSVKFDYDDTNFKDEQAEKIRNLESLVKISADKIKGF